MYQTGPNTTTPPDYHACLQQQNREGESASRW